ncbi:MAG TPA: alkylmercury lyase family protein [Thermoplasmata archaeon]
MSFPAEPGEIVATPDPELDRRARKRVFDTFRARAVPPMLEDLMAYFRLSRSDSFEVLRRLEAARHLKLVPGTQRILMAFPFSAIATPFRVHAGGMSYFANCAWDAVAFHATLGQPVRIESHCHHCASALRIEVAGGRIRQSNVPEPLVYIALPAARWWEDIVSTCSNHMVFFESPAHLADWRRAGSATDGVALSVEETHHVGLPIYRAKTDLDYARPSKDELIAHFASLGLTSDFWKL